MQTTGKNKMISGARSKSEERRISVQKGERYFFPEHQATVQASSREEAEKKVEKEGSK